MEDYDTPFPVQPKNLKKFLNFLWPNSLFVLNGPELVPQVKNSLPISTNKVSNES